MRFEEIRGETGKIVVRPAMPDDYAGCGPAKNRCKDNPCWDAGEENHEELP